MRKTNKKIAALIQSRMLNVKQFYPCSAMTRDRFVKAAVGKGLTKRQIQVFVPQAIELRDMLDAAIKECVNNEEGD